MPCRSRSRRTPRSGEPILVGIGRYGPYVQHGKTYANLEKDDDVLAIGANRAIDLIVARRKAAPSSAAARQRDPGRALGEEPGTGKTVVVKAGRFGPYVTDGEVNATLPAGAERRRRDARRGDRAHRRPPRRRPVEEAAPRHARRRQGFGAKRQGGCEEANGQEGRHEKGGKKKRQRLRLLRRTPLPEGEGQG